MPSSQVALSKDGHVMAASAEWTPTTPAGATSKSGVWVTKRISSGHGAGTDYQPWTKVKTDQSGDGSVAEFGTSIQVWNVNPGVERQSRCGTPIRVRALITRGVVALVPFFLFFFFYFFLLLT